MSGTPTPRAATRYVRADRLLPGDVFLSRGGDKDSTWIARSTFGPFSHAAIYDGNHFLFEAIDDGVGYTKLNLARACRNPGQGSFILIDVSHYNKLEIRRHPAIEEACKTLEGRRNVIDQLIGWLGPKNGLEYPALSTLAKAVPFVPWPLAFALLWVIARFQGEPSKVVPGMFCSQLVACALRDLDAEPLQSTFWGQIMTPEKISPNRLQSRKTQLKLVDDIIVDDKYPCECDASQQYFLEQMRQLQDQTNAMVAKCGAMERRKALLDLENRYRRYLR